MRLIVALPIIALSACTWVKTDPGAESVAVKTASEVVACDYLGKASAVTKDRLLWGRNAAKVQTELLTLARNEAVKMEGNTVVPQADMAEGRQSFAVYRCP